jgi:3'-phosphoadenosine 5'-phosphosulfate sulfotransferase (PAPS reductase)/FAD synthetase
MGQLDISSYDYYILAFSGGKDSLACLLHLLESGVDREKIELWHHDVDGREGSSLMDWPVTRSYCQTVADAFELPIYFSWKVGGFEREMLRNETRTAPTSFEIPMVEYQNGDTNAFSSDRPVRTVGGTRGKLGTRRKFPQVSADLSCRWCSAYLKIDVCTAAINNQKRFQNKRTLVITGERAEESKARANYKTFEPDRSDNRSGKRIVRHVDHWRPVHQWTESQVWDIIKKHRVNPHPAYKLGWGRLSCMTCIFGSKDQWATIKAIANNKFEVIAKYEEEFGVTIQRNESVRELAAKGTCYPAAKNLELINLAKGELFTQKVIIEQWEQPAGAFGENAGPI